MARDMYNQVNASYEDRQPKKVEDKPVMLNESALPPLSNKDSRTKSVTSLSQKGSSAIGSSNVNKYMKKNQMPIDI